MKKDMRTDKQKEYEEKMYHNTEILLKRYRDVVWSIEVSAIQARMNFEYEMGCSLDEFLQMSYVMLTDTDISPIINAGNISKYSKKGKRRLMSLWKAKIQRHWMFCSDL